MRKAFIKYAKRENKVFKSLSHQNIVKYLGTIPIDEHTLCTVLEYCDGEDLDVKIKKKGFFSEKEARPILEQVLNAVKYLNEVDPKIIHYDLKPANILFTKCGELKITDFGLSKTMKSD